MLSNSSPERALFVCVNGLIRLSFSSFPFPAPTPLVLVNGLDAACRLILIWIFQI